MSRPPSAEPTPPAEPAHRIRPVAPAILLVAGGALAGGMGWGIRGQYGHETGAMIAGLLVSLVLVRLACPGAALMPAARAVAWTTTAIGIGGAMTYGQTIGLTQDAALVGNWAALRWGLLGLAVKGGIWIGFAGAFLGMGLGGVGYRARELAAVLLALLGLFFAGVWLLNRPFDPAARALPTIYFSADWYWRPDAALTPRPEVWGGLLTALTALVAYVATVRRDGLAWRLALWGVAGGALGFPLGQSLQAFHAWNPELFRQGLWVGLDPVINWWNLMETTFGAVMGAALGLGLWWNRARIAGMDAPAIATLGMRTEWLLVTVHLALLLTSELTDLPIVGRYTDLSLLLALLPIVGVAGGRWWPLLLPLPITLVPIAVKTVRRLAYQDGAIAPAPGWTLYLVLPVAFALALAVRHVRSGDAPGAGLAFSRQSLLLTTWLYVGLNFAFFRYPWPWEPWTPRTPHALIFLACAVGLTWLATSSPSAALPRASSAPS